MGCLLIAMVRTNAQTLCPDMNGYVNYRVNGSTAYDTLIVGNLEEAAQTYYYSGPGKISSVRIFGQGPGSVEGGVALTIGVYNVDNTGRPTTLIQSADATWWWDNNAAGYIDVFFANGGVTVNNNFAVSVQLRNAFPFGTSLYLQYTANGGGLDLASLAGSQTGGIWVSALNTYSMNADFFIVPNMTNFIRAVFQPSTVCAASGASVSFTNNTQMSTDSMFNLIGWLASPSYHYYEWNFGDGSPVSYATNPSHAFSAPGNYTVSLTSTLVGWSDTCSDTRTMQISVGLAAGIASVTNNNCYGASSGSVIITGSGGTGNYQYSLNAGATVSSSNTFTGLPANNYTAYVIDTLGCMDSIHFSITQAPAIVFITSSVTNASCGNANGSILASASGGTGSLQYSLNGGAYQASGSFTNIGAGPYTITAKDSNGCTKSVNVVVNDAGAPQLTVVSAGNISCYGGNNGSIILSGTGGTGTLQYSINGGQSFQASGIFSNLLAGNYVAMVKDALGCSELAEVSLTQPQQLVFETGTVADSCHGGSNGQINILNASGGTGSYVYGIGGNNYQSTPSFNNLAAGLYMVYMKDAANCIAVDTVIVHQPSAIIAATSVTNATCNGSYNGSLNVTASGGTGAYTFSINGSGYQPDGNFSYLPAGNYTITIMDANGCTAAAGASITQPSAVTLTITTGMATCGNSTGSLLATATGGSGIGYVYALSSNQADSTGLFDSLAAGTYYVVASDNKGCGAYAIVTIADANGPQITGISSTNVSCNGGSNGSITINTVTGGTGTLLYAITGRGWQFANSFTSLSAGIYTAEVVDGNGCTGTVQDTITQPEAFSVHTTVTNLTCYDDNTGAVTIYASGGAGLFAYSDDGGVTFQSSNTFTGLMAGQHFIILHDAADCSDQVDFTITQPARLQLSSSVLNVACNSAASGSIILSATGGTGSYVYSLNGGNYQSSNVFTGLTAGSYSAAVKDSNGCITTLAVTLTQPYWLVVVPAISEVSCAGGSNGAIALQVYGGIPPYEFYWNTGSYNQDIFNLGAGTYDVTVSDANRCIDSATYIITQPASPLMVNATVNNATGGNNNGAISLVVTGGDGPYSFAWSNNDTTQTITGLAPGTYSVDVKDVNGCVVSGIYIVSEIAGITETAAGILHLSIYPNPTAGTTTIEVAGRNITHLKITNLIGQSVLETWPSQAKVEVDCSSFSPGLYLVEAEIGGLVFTKRMMVSK